MTTTDMPTADAAVSGPDLNDALGFVRRVEMSVEGRATVEYLAGRHMCHSGGVVQDTCLCTLMLEVYYRYLPSFKHVEAGPDDVAATPAKNEDITVKIR